jgi:hypothetical protein
MEEGGVAITLLQPIDERTLPSHYFLNFKKLTKLRLNISGFADTGLINWARAKEQELALEPNNFLPH